MRIKQWAVVLACALVALLLAWLTVHLFGAGSHNFAQPYLP